MMQKLSNHVILQSRLERALDSIQPPTSVPSLTFLFHTISRDFISIQNFLISFVYTHLHIQQMFVEERNNDFPPE